MADTVNGQDNDEVLMQLKYLHDMYTQQYANIENSIATYSLTSTSINKNIELIEKSNSIENSEAMIGGDGGAYITAKINKISSIMTYIGAGYLVEKDIEQALAFLRENQKSSTEVLNRLVNEKQRLEREIFDLEYKMGALQYQMSAQQ